METAEKNSALGYGKPPWVFKGSALYQLHLVKAETARAFIPKEFRLVEAFGYTLGGFFLANYEDSPAGIFDELVVIAGIVWNPPTSCAWAARVLVNSDKACVHGRKDVGLPSQVANFTKSLTALPVTKRGRFGCFLNKIGMADSPDKEKNCMDIRVKEMNNHISLDLCSINITAAAMAASQNDTRKWMGPAIKMSLPSFSGRTEYNPHLLKYSCQIECRLRAVPPAKVSGPSTSSTNPETTSETGFATGDSSEDKRNLTISVMLSKPILALEFNCLKMKVEAPTIVPQ
ncbi:protein NEOXANTHIN-DEFICIENT 1 [Sesamum indicum]|uniref:Protein NEOXANTHIN-DEFICIENT 1 n=1 Tax=Sesamum indicum TaxID=4182 RepID=A0A6I9TLV1_SESIN|nr:protein NEOXANTHIN-DEFICIENT 1 [Sesamum indicum]XP_011086873.1 protein NEOXANTHIN-DEFICIENT 1 [Sesamum indicum]XP_020551774.1 protein NEOXANTHIN-DEFICIENT 1 [Sesamum indicum]XP_020551775.1 protein NEOXANTHIN-DEFICIENT 1 [Sesamum indicum]XP_020551776.1 protein NEOXANTHIN-DEFICIENT 1 [Sesamum indicum]